MKKILTALLLITLASASQAATKAEKDEYCKGVKDAAEATMGARLAGVDITNVMRIAGDDKIYQAMAHDAYTAYAYKTDEYKASAIKDFGAKYYLDCLTRAK